MCDVDRDGDVDRNDINLIFGARGSQATSGDPRDSNGDGFITINDGRFCVLQCTSPRCGILNRPVANAGPDQTVPRDSTVQLDGSASTDIDGNPLTYRWEIKEQPDGSSAQLSDPTLVNPTFLVDQPGSYLLQLIVNDGALDSLPDTATINTSNSAPVAKAGEDQFVFVGDTTKLDGSASSDVDGDQLTFFWELTTIPDQSTATLLDPTALMPTFLVDQPGTYEATLIVNDGAEASQPDTVIITTQNSKPVADADGDQLTFSWALISKPDQSTATLTNPTDPNPTLTIDRFGTYVAQLIVHDGTLPSEPDTVTVSTLNSRPVADAGKDQTVRVQETVQLDGRDSFDADLDPLTFRWAFTTRPPNSTATFTDDTTDSPTFVPDVSGTYIAQLIVNDGLLDSAPDTVTTTVTDPNIPPVANAGLDQLGTVGKRAFWIGSQSFDDNNDPLTYQWTLRSAPPGSTATLTAPTTVTASLVPDQVGFYEVQLVVHDGTEASAPKTAMVEARELNEPPTIISTPGTTGLVDQAYTYDVEATDPNLGDRLTYSLPLATSGMTIDSGTGLIEWTPGAEQVGPHDITVKVEDGQGGLDFQTFIMQVAPINLGPTAVDDGYDARQGQTLTVPASGVLANDPDPNGDALTATLMTPPTKGTVSLHGDGSFTYTPPAQPPITVGFDRQCNASADIVSGSGTMVVGDVDGDGDTEIVGMRDFFGTFWIIDGATCATEFPPTSVPRFSGWSTPALLDIDGDGDLEIIAPANIQLGPNSQADLLMAVHHDGTLAWTGNNVNGTSESLSHDVAIWTNSHVTLADLDGDGRVEILMPYQFQVSTSVSRDGVAAYNSADGTLLWEYDGPPFIPALNGFRAPVLHVIDLDLDGTREVIMGQSVVDHTGQLEFLLPIVPRGGLIDQIALAFANFDTDPFPEILVRDRQFHYCSTMTAH